MEKEKRLVANIWETPDGTFLWSRYRHDYVHYVDANGEEYSVDGGNDYYITLVNKEKMKSHCVYNTDPWDLQRQYILRGTSDEDLNRIWVPLCKLSDNHLKGIIEYCEKYGQPTEVYEKELEYRKENNLSVAEHSYKNECINNIIKIIKPDMKTELIEQLYKEGKITFEQAMTLAGSTPASDEETQIPSPVATGIPTESLSKEEIFINKIVDEIAEEHHDEDGTLLSFDIKKIVNFMHDNCWTWLGKPVDEKEFKNTLKDYLKDVLRNTVKDYLKGEWKETYNEFSDQWPCYHVVECGGICVESWYNYKDEVIEAEAKFIAETAFSCGNVNELK